MRINQMQNKQINKVQLDKVNRTKYQNDEEKIDKIEISKTAINIKVFKQELDKIPEVRAEKVELLKKRVQNGTYQVPARAMAKKMLEVKDWE